MLKKVVFYWFFLVLPILALFSVGNSPAAISANQISLKLDGKDVTTSALPVIENGRTLIPIRFISEEMGGQRNEAIAAG